MSAIVLKAFWANGTSLGIDVELGVRWASDTSFSVPDWLVDGTGIGGQGSTGGIVADAFQLR